ncbi:MAG: S41 family peptidase, partial [Anaerovoracaceae bacterium]
MKSKKALAVSFLLGLVIGIGGMWAAVNMLGGAIVPSDDYSNIRYLSKAGMLMNYVNDSYYRETDMDDLADGMYKGIVAGLDDPYSVYMTEDEYENWKLDLAGNYCGIGITISGDDDGLEVVRIVSGSPADEAGFEIGDIINIQTNEHVSYH